MQRSSEIDEICIESGNGGGTSGFNTGVHCGDIISYNVGRGVSMNSFEQYFWSMIAMWIIGILLSAALYRYQVPALAAICFACSGIAFIMAVDILWKGWKGLTLQE